MLPLYGIFHLAGTTLDKPISKSSPEDFYKVLSPKLYAAWELHQATKHLPNLHVFALLHHLAIKKWRVTVLCNFLQHVF